MGTLHCFQRVRLFRQHDMAPLAIRDLRRMLRYRNLVVRQTTRMKNRMAGLLMETGVAYNKERLHGKAYFSELLDEMRRSIPEDATLWVIKRIHSVELEIRRSTLEKE